MSLREKILGISAAVFTAGAAAICVASDYAPTDKVLRPSGEDRQTFAPTARQVFMPADYESVRENGATCIINPVSGEVVSYTPDEAKNNPGDFSQYTCFVTRNSDRPNFGQLGLRIYVPGFR